MGLNKGDEIFLSVFEDSMSGGRWRYEAGVKYCYKVKIESVEKLEISCPHTVTHKTATGNYLCTECGKIGRPDPASFIWGEDAD